MIVLLFGNNCSAKTELAEKLCRFVSNSILIDGSEVRDGLNSDLKTTEEDGEEGVRRVAEVARLINKQHKTVIVSVVCPTEETRKIFKDVTNEMSVYTVYFSTSSNHDDETTQIFEEPKVYDLKIDIDNQEEDECLELILKNGLHRNLSGMPIGTPQENKGPKHAFKAYNRFHMSLHLWAINYAYKFAFPLVAKCASTQLSQWTYEDNKKCDSNEIGNEWRVKSINDIPEGFIKFAVYRDPIERFYSACHFPGYDAKEVIKEFTGYTYENGVCKDQHMRRQSDFYKIEDVDYIVKLADLNGFLNATFNYNTESRNVYKHPVFEDVDLTLSDDELNYVKEYYKDDWDIEKSEKIWKNNKENIE